MRRGDTLSKIAKHHAVSVEDLREWNGITGDLIEVGQVIQIRVPQSPDLTSAPKDKRRKLKQTARSTQNQSQPRMPSKKKCISGPSLDDLSEDVPDIQASKGLSYEEIRKPLATFLPTLGQCFSGDWPEARVLFEITAGCDGRVSKVVVLDDGGLSNDRLDCMRSTLSFVGFPAHDMPDGMTFQYPVTLGG